MASEIKVDTISEKTSANGVTIDGVNIKDSALATAGSVPLTTIDIDGGTDIGAAIVDADLFIVDDGAGGTNRKVTASRLKTYAGTTINNATQSELVTIGSTTTELDAEANLTFTGSALTVKVPPSVVVPLTSAVPLISIAVAVKSISSVAPIDNTVAEEPCIN